MSEQEFKSGDKFLLNGVECEIVEISGGAVRFSHPLDPNTTITRNLFDLLAASSQPSAVNLPAPKFKDGDRVLVKNCSYATLNGACGEILSGPVGQLEEYQVDLGFKFGIRYLEASELELVASATPDPYHQGTREEKESVKFNHYPIYSDAEPACLCSSPAAHENTCDWMRWKEKQ